MEQDENQQIQETSQQAGQQDTSYDYSQPLFQTKSVSIASFASAVIFIAVGVIDILFQATSYPIQVGAVCMVVGVILLVRNILLMRGISIMGALNRLDKQ